MVTRNIGRDLVSFVYEENILVNESIFPKHVVQEYVQTPGRKHDKKRNMKVFPKMGENS